MIIKSLKVIFNEKEFLFGFTKNCNLIYSKENSKGKTTLVRFLLYALGYQIPATAGIGDFAKFTFILNITINGKNITITRHDTEVLLESDNNKINYSLP